ncbi:hypothetical protein [Pararhizobium sp. A13]
MKSFGFAATDANKPLVPFTFENDAFERMERSDVRYRFVIDMASLEAAA